MRTKLIACAAATLIGPAAFAGHGSSRLVVDNDFDGGAEVFVDGRYHGTVRGDSVATFDIRPGNRSVTIKRPNGYPLLVTRVHTHGGQLVRLDVDAPMATLAVRNPTWDHLWVRVDGRVVPLAPQQGFDLRVESGDVDLVVESRERYGTRVVERRKVWVEPGTTQKVAVHDTHRPGGPVYVDRPAVAWHDGHDDRDHDRDRWGRDRWDRDDDDDRWDKDRRRRDDD